MVAQPPGGGGRPPGGGGGGGNSLCPDVGVFAGSEEYMDVAGSGSGNHKRTAPALGNIGCVDNPGNTTNERGDFIEIGKDIFGLFEGGFRSDQFPCDTTDSVPGGLDTETAQSIINKACGRTDFQLLNPCGGHAYFHYHEKMGCLYEPDPITLHSTRVGTALDGNGIYGDLIDGGVLPTDSDACGGRFGITPDSDGEIVYYYPIKSTPPFTMSCYGPIGSVEECRDLYEECGNGDIIEVDTLDGPVLYDPWCPCFDESGSNVGTTTASDTTEPVTGSGLESGEASDESTESAPGSGSENPSEEAVEADTDITEDFLSDNSGVESLHSKSFVVAVRATLTAVMLFSLLQVL